MLGELDRVAKQVNENLTQSSPIDFKGFWNTRFDNAAQGQSFFFGAMLNHLRGIACQLPNITLGGCQINLAQVGFGKVQNVIDEHQQVLRRVVNDRDLIDFSGRQRLAMKKRLGVAEDGVKRRAKFMADSGQKPVFGLVGDFRRFLRRLKLAGLEISSKCQPHVAGNGAQGAQFARRPLPLGGAGIEPQISPVNFASDDRNDQKRADRPAVKPELLDRGRLARMSYQSLAFAKDGHPELRQDVRSGIGFGFSGEPLNMLGHSRYSRAWALNEADAIRMGSLPQNPHAAVERKIEIRRCQQQLRHVCGTCNDSLRLSQLLRSLLQLHGPLPNQIVELAIMFLKFTRQFIGENRVRHPGQIGGDNRRKCIPAHGIIRGHHGGEHSQDPLTGAQPSKNKHAVSILGFERSGTRMLERPAEHPAVDCFVHQRGQTRRCLGFQRRVEREFPKRIWKIKAGDFNRQKFAQMFDGHVEHLIASRRAQDIDLKAFKRNHTGDQLLMNRVGRIKSGLCGIAGAHN